MPKGKRRIKLSVSVVFTDSLIGMFFIFLILMAIIYSQFQKSLLSSLTKQNEEFASQVSSTTKLADEILISITNQLFYDPAVTLLGEGATDQQIARLRAQLRLDEPVWSQLGGYVGGLLQGDLGAFCARGALHARAQLRPSGPAQERS